MLYSSCYRVADRGIPLLSFSISAILFTCVLATAEKVSLKHAVIFDILFHIVRKAWLVSIGVI